MLDDDRVVILAPGLPRGGNRRDSSGGGGGGGGGSGDPKLDVPPNPSANPSANPSGAPKLDAGSPDVVVVDDAAGKDGAENGGPGGEPAAEKAKDPEAIVALAEAALDARRWTDPPETSLAAHLSDLQLVAPGDSSLSRLRKEAAEVLLPEGDKALKKKAWADAVVAYRNLRSIWPDHGEARDGLVEALEGQARVLRKLDDHEGALATADEWLNVDPGAFEAHMLRGDMLFELSRFEEAKDAYRLARQEKPRSKAAKEKFFKASYRARKEKG